MAGGLREKDGKLVGPSSMKDYTVDSANTEEDKNYSQEQESLDSAFIPDDESFTGSTVLDAGYNAAKIVAEEAFSVLPLAERLLGFNAYESDKGHLGSKHSGWIDSLYGMATSDIKNKNFVRIAKDQKDEGFSDYLTQHLNSNVLTPELLAEKLMPLAQEAGYIANSIDDLSSLLERSNSFRDWAQNTTNDLKEDYMVKDRDYYEDENYTYIKNFNEIDGVNVAWTRGDLQLPNLGVYKVQDDGQAYKVANAMLNLKDSGTVGGGGDNFDYLDRTSLGTMLGDQGFGPDQYSGDFELYGSPAAKIGGMAASLPLSGAVFGGPNAVKQIINAPTNVKKMKEFGSMSLLGIPSKKGAAIVGGGLGIGSLPYLAGLINNE
jgi:hypothetical protein